MKKAILGKAGQSNVSIDIEALLASRLLVTAQSGGGKSWLLRRIAEQTAGQVQQIIIDPEGEFYTLREKHPYIVAGKDGDCPAPYLVKGTQVHVTGRLQTRSWEAQDGTKRYATEVVASDVILLGGNSSQGSQRPPAAPDDDMAISDDDVPF